MQIISQNTLNEIVKMDYLGFQIIAAALIAHHPNYGVVLAQKINNQNDDGFSWATFQFHIEDNGHVVFYLRHYFNNLPDAGSSFTNRICNL